MTILCGINCGLAVFRLSPHPCIKMSSANALAQLAAKFSRQMASSAGGIGRKVVVLGAAGGIGQPLSMLMKVRLFDTS